MYYVIQLFVLIAFSIAATSCQPELQGTGTMLDRGRKTEAELAPKTPQGRREAPTSGPTTKKDGNGTDSQLDKGIQSTFVFSAINPLASPWQGTVYGFDPESGALSTILSGESSDPAVYSANGAAWLFNRAADNSNMRVMKREPGQSFTSTRQTHFAGAGSGDPHDIFALSDARLLLANYVEGNIATIDSTSGDLIEAVSADWDLPAGVLFHPEAFVQVKNRAGERFVLVVHQALGLRDGGMFVNGSQQIFVLRLEGDHVTVVDLDEATPKVQGIRLKGSMPIPVRYGQRERPLFVSMCSRYLTAGDRPEEMCHAAVEELDPETMKVKVLMDLDGKDLFMNGMVQPGWNENSFFASIERKINDNKYVMEVVQIDLEAQSIKTTYEYFEQRFGGFWAMFSDVAHKRLFIGDMSDFSVGKFRAFVDGGVSYDVALPMVPYSGVKIETALP